MNSIIPLELVGLVIIMVMLVGLTSPSLILAAIRLKKNP